MLYKIVATEPKPPIAVIGNAGQVMFIDPKRFFYIILTKETDLKWEIGFSEYHKLPEIIIFYYQIGSVGPKDIA